MKNICPTCKLEFNSKVNKLYCSMRCYMLSDTFKLNQDKLKETNKIKHENGSIEVECLNCGKKYVSWKSNPRKFCSKPCLRKYYKERFDRFIANPETIALPQAYDEFLCKEKLPCLFEDCDWVGFNLGLHVNRTHGISAREFKKLAGFNLKTGLVTTELSEQMSEKAYNQNLAQYRPDNANNNLTRNNSDYRSLEGKEHWVKAIKGNENFIRAGIASAKSEAFKQKARERIEITREENKNTILDKECPSCNKKFQISIMYPRTKYCSKECKKVALSVKFGDDKIYDVICHHCLCKFKATYQVFRKQEIGKRVFCSRQCISAYHVVHKK